MPDFERNDYQRGIEYGRQHAQCALHPGHALVWCEACIAYERKMSALDKTELVDDLAFTVDLMFGVEPLTPEQWNKLGQIRRRVIDRRRAEASSG